jgi:hypothetical protein
MMLNRQYSSNNEYELLIYDHMFRFYKMKEYKFNNFKVFQLVLKFYSINTLLKTLKKHNTRLKKLIYLMLKQRNISKLNIWNHMINLVLKKDKEGGVHLLCQENVRRFLF